MWQAWKRRNCIETLVGKIEGNNHREVLRVDEKAILKRIILVLSDKGTLLFSIIKYTFFIEDGPKCFEPYIRFIFRDICFKLHKPFFKGTC
jgi:hypothetical protein